MRIITPTDHPSYVSVFTAASFPEALERSYEENARAGIQASLWYKPNEPLPWESELKLAREFERIMRYPNEGLGGLTRYNIIVNAENGHNSFGFKRNRPVPDYALQESRRETLEYLSGRFGSAQLAVRHSRAGTLRKHHDRDDMQQGEMKSKFMHRALCTHNGLGTFIYDSADPDAKPCMPPNGSYLFLSRRDSALEKSLLHSNPVYILPKTARPRTADVYDF